MSDNNRSSRQAALGSPMPGAAPASTGTANEGGSAPQALIPPGLVIPGESSLPHGFPESGESLEVCALRGRAVAVAHPCPHPVVLGYTAITDFLNVTFPLQREVPHRLIEAILNIQGLNLEGAIDLRKGFCGYHRSWRLGEYGAHLAYGGQAGTALISIPGKACAAVTDWEPFIEFVRDQHGGRVTRWDGAVDDFEGTHSLDWAMATYLNNGFGCGGNKPRMKQSGNWALPDGRGRTLYIGNRKNGKLLRVYEKGQQLGNEVSPWVRYELELHNVSRVVPWDVLSNPGRYVAGGYPKALGWITEEMSRIRTLRKEEAISYEHLVKYASIAYGPLFNVMLKREGSPEAVVKKLLKPGKPARLMLPVDLDKQE